MGGRAVVVLHVGLPAVTPLPGWRFVVRAVAVAAVSVLAVAGIDIAHSGLVHPWVALVGLVGTAFVNRVYVVMTKRGNVLEAIDIAEAPIVALAMLLPPGEAVLIFGLASLLMELPLERALVKKVFNVSVRVVGAAVLVTPLALFDVQRHIGAVDVTAAVFGALAYSAVSTIALGLVVASVQERQLRSVLCENLSARAIVWVTSTTLGIATAAVALKAPVALVALAATLVLLSMSTRSAERLRREDERLQHLLDATTRIQSTEAAEEQEAVLVEVTRDALQWKDVEVRDRPPEVDERGRRLWGGAASGRWLVVARRPGSDPWLPDDDNVVDFLAHSANVAFARTAQKQDLARQALLDPLTGVANRRQFDREVSALNASGRSYGIVLCDLDHFKAVNDRLGHEAGDQLLRIAAARLTASLRAGDLVARIGGDEFLVLLPGVASMDALQRIRDSITERLAQRVALGPWQLSSLPCSLGVAAAPRDGRSLREVLRAADESMYDEKRVHKAEAPPITITLPDASAIRLDKPA